MLTTILFILHINMVHFYENAVFFFSNQKWCLRNIVSFYVKNMKIHSESQRRAMIRLTYVKMHNKTFTFQFIREETMLHALITRVNKQKSIRLLT